MTKQSTVFAMIALAFLILMLVVPVSASTATVINQGATVFIGEGGLDVTRAVSPDNVIGWWAPGAVLASTSPDHTISMVSQASSFTITPSEFAGRTGTWYHVVGGMLNSTAPTPAFTVADPVLDLQIWNLGSGGQSFNGKTIVQGTNLTFRIQTNMYSINSTAATGAGYRWNQGNDVSGFMDIKFKGPQGATLNKLFNTTKDANNLTGLVIGTTPYVWGSESIQWATGVLDSNGQKAYPVGTYTVWAESTLNSMKDNYKNTGGADYTSKTVSPQYIITLSSDSVAIVTNKEVVVRSKSFATTVTGKPNTDYYVWVKGSNMLGNTTNNQPPMIMASQEWVFVGDIAASLYSPQNYGTRNISQDVPQVPEGTQSWAKINTGASGIRVIEFITTPNTKAQKYTIRVETSTPDPSGSNTKSDEVGVTVEKGSITVVAQGSQSYFLGEEITFTGTNSETYQTYLFITGPNLPTDGAQIQDANPRTKAVRNGVLADYQAVDVSGANTWSYKWGTGMIALDSGTYTVYAVSAPNNSANLVNVAFGTTSVLIKKPFVSATASQSTVAQGDKLFISGVAEGKPAVGVQVWVLGKNYEKDSTTSINADSSFKYEITQAETKNLAPGQYFVVIQHPMQNMVFDIAREGNSIVNKQYGSGSGMTIFKMLDQGSLQGSDAAEALIQGITDANVDDTYTKLQFLVENPIITITPVGDKHVGDKFTILASTNLAVDDEVLVEVYSSSFKPTQKSQSGEFSGITGTIKVAKGDSGMNKLTFDVDSSTFKPDEYIVKESAILQEAVGSVLFNVLEGSAPAPTVVKTTAPTVATTVPTPAPTAAPVVETTTAVPLTKPTASPGAGALLALIGLGAVGFIVVRRE